MRSLRDTNDSWLHRLMDVLHDLLAFPGSVGLGINNHNNHGDEVSVERPKHHDTRHPGILSPLRNLLRPSLDTLGGIYRNGEPASKPGDYRVQVLKLRLSQVRTIAGQLFDISDGYRRLKLMPNGSPPLPSWTRWRERMPGNTRNHRMSTMSRLSLLD